MGSKTERETCIWIHTSLLDINNNEQQPSEDERSTSTGTSSSARASSNLRNTGKQQQRGNSRRRQHYSWVRGHIILSSNNHPSSKSLLAVRITDTSNDRFYYNKTITLPSSQNNDNHILMANVYGDDDTMLPPNNLIHLTHLHEPALVECLQLRYNLDQIYTYTGPILLALNPFKPVKDLYSESVMQYYYDWGCSYSIATSSRQPHVYAIADDAFRNMIRIIHDNNNISSREKQQHQQGDITSSPDQSILVSGESGAGKTVTTKFIMAYLASLSERSGTNITPPSTNTTSSYRDGVSSSSSSSRNSSRMSHATTKVATTNKQQSIEQQVLQSNPILESFGNARTIRNDNSSRFGKFISINFQHTTLLGATIRTYLLEKVRLVHQMPEERTFHVFYELLSVQDKKRFHLLSSSSPKDFKMTSASNTLDRRDGVSDRETFQELKVAMDVVGFSKQEQSDIFAVVSAILHASNFTFVERQHQKNSTTTTTDAVPCSSFTNAASLLGVDTEKLRDALCTCTIVVAGKSITKTLSCEQAIKANESMMKSLYGALFSFLVNRINQSISGTTSSSDSGHNNISFNSNHHDTTTAKINVLDIFGFESFDVNSFEQLCINYCNEALQQQFNRFVFKLEQQEYEREGIEWSFIEFPDNQDVLDLIDHKRTGIMSVLNEQCRLARSTDRSFANATIDRCQDHTRFSCTNMQKGAGKFSIQHFAGPVEYTTTNFIEKNKDELPQEGIELLFSSSNNFVAFLGSMLSSTSNASVTSSKENFNDNGSSAASSNNKSSSLSRASVCAQFSVQLRELRERIERTTPHYVRCLKPNELLLPNKFDPCIIADQLRCAGVLEAIRVSRVGFPQRYLHDLFFSRYFMLASKKELKEVSKLHRMMRPCEVLVHVVARKIRAEFGNHNNAHDSAFGCNLYNIDPTHRSKLSRTSNEAPNLLEVGIQIGQTKVFLRREAFDALESLRIKKMESSAVKLQSTIRGHITRLFYVIQMYCAVCLQSKVRQYLSRQIVLSMRYFVTATKLQTFWRMFIARYLHTARLHLERSVLMVQTSWRVYMPRRNYFLRKQLASAIQGQYRCRVARAVLKSLVQQARDHKQEQEKLRIQSIHTKNDLKSREQAEHSTMLLQLKSIGAVKKEGPISYNLKSFSHDANDKRGILLPIDKGPVPSINHSIIYRNFPVNPTAKDEELRMLAEASYQKDKEIEALRQELDILRKRSTDWSDQKSQRSSTLQSDESESPFALRELFFHRARRSGTSENLVSNATPSKTPPNSNSIVGKNFFSSPIEVFQSISGKVLLKSASQALKNERNAMEQINLSSEWEDRSSLSDAEMRNSTTIVASSTFMDDNYRTTSIHEAVIVQDEIGLLESLDSCNDVDMIINMGDIEGKAALHLAAINSSTTIAKILMDHMALTNVQDVMGNTPLHYACHVPLIKLLIEKGRANPNIPNAMGFRPLHFAVARKHVEAVEYLLASGADVDVADDVNWYTPLHVLVQPSAASALVSDIMASPEICLDSDNQSISLSVAELLCNANADLNSKDREGNTPFHYATRLVNRKTLELLELFSKKGGNPKVMNLKGQTPLHYFCNNVSLRQFVSYHDILLSLVVHSDPNIATQSGCTPLHLALYHQDIDAAEILVKHGAQLNLPWAKPDDWAAFWDDRYASTVLPLDMVRDEYSIRRLLSAISKPQLWAQGRLACMSCVSLFGAFKRQHHCRHCGRLICGSCSTGVLDITYFPPLFAMETGSASLRVCTVCEDILTSRRKRTRAAFP